MSHASNPILQWLIAESEWMADEWDPYYLGMRDQAMDLFRVLRWLDAEEEQAVEAFINLM